MIKHIKDYTSEFERDLNIPLMTKEADAPLVEYVVDSWKSLCIVRNIQFLGYEYTETESEIDINKYIFKREKKTPKKEKFDYKFVDDTRAGRLTVEMLITSIDKDPKTKKSVTHQKIVKKSMLIPLLDENGMAYIKGKKYYLIYQMVEKSTYTAANAVILKSLMPFAIRRTSATIEDMAENEYTIPIYNIELYKKDIPIMLIYAANGLSFAVQYALDMPYIAMNFVTSYEKEDKKNLYFQISSKLFLKVNKKLFDNYTYVQSVVGGILEISTNRLTIDNIDDKNIWLKKLSNNNIEKGKNLITSLQRLMDETTKKMLKVNVYRKLDVLSVIKYMTENYNDLRAKDNMNLNNKRLRCNEYIASLLTQEFSKRLNRIMSLGNKATIDNYREMFKFSGDILIQKMHSSGILRFCDAINDLDFFSKFKYTNKGPHSAGGKNSNSIGIRYRGIHPSFIGKIDLTVCGNSDPGTSGTLSPFSKDIKGLYFNDEDEPDNFIGEFRNSVKEILDEDGVDYISVKFDDSADYYNILHELHQFTVNNIKVSCTSKMDEYEVVLEEENLDDVSK